MPAFSVSPLVLLILLLSLLPPSCCAAPSSSCSAYSLACWGVDCGAGYSCTACTADDDGFPQPTCESISDSSSALTSAVLFGVVVASLCGLVIIGSAIAISVRVGLCCCLWANRCVRTRWVAPSAVPVSHVQMSAGPGDGGGGVRVVYWMQPAQPSVQPAGTVVYVQQSPHAPAYPPPAYSGPAFALPSAPTAFVPAEGVRRAPQAGVPYTEGWEEVRKPLPPPV